MDRGGDQEGGGCASRHAVGVRGVGRSIDGGSSGCWLESRATAGTGHRSDHATSGHYNLAAFLPYGESDHRLDEVCQGEERAEHLQRSKNALVK